MSDAPDSARDSRDDARDARDLARDGRDAARDNRDAARDLEPRSARDAARDARDVTRDAARDIEGDAASRVVRDVAAGRWGAAIVTGAMAVFGGGGFLSFSSIQDRLTTAIGKLDELTRSVAKQETRNEMTAAAALAATKVSEDHENRLRDHEKRLAIVEAKTSK